MKIREWLSLQIAKKPGRFVLVSILLFNIVFFTISAFLISFLSLSGTEEMGVLEAAFYTVSMILDAGCISYVVQDIGNTGVALVITCIAVVIIGMISFTGSVIGYVTNWISNFIDQANSGYRRINISDHTVILNWNSRGSEIVNDLLYCETKQKVVILVQSGKEEIQKDIEERLSDTIARESEALGKKFKNKVTVVVREGDVFSTKQLRDISIERAKMIIILNNDISNDMCKFDALEKSEARSRGNTLTVKTLMQVADITSAEYSDDDQKIVVEIADEWTGELVDNVIKYKQVDAKCNIVPVRINTCLGQLLSQFSLMPELNLAYRELFSNKGATFNVVEKPEMVDDETFVSEYLATHTNAIPLTYMTSGKKIYAFFSSEGEEAIGKPGMPKQSSYSVELNRKYWIEKKKVVILGHNSKSLDIMRGFENFRHEWNYRNSKDEILEITILDDAKSLEKLNYYREFPFVVKTVPCNIYDREIICNTIEEVISSNEEDTSILILSDDRVVESDIDANALAHLVYVQEIINSKVAKNPKFDTESIDVIVEIIDPKHHDIVSNYSVDNVVISNRYISKMITQIGEKEPLFDFYCDILTYDDDEYSEQYESKEIYVKRVSTFFNSIPKECTAAELIRAVYNASVDESIPSEEHNPTIVLGYVKPGGKIVLFKDDQEKTVVRLESRDKLIVFSSH